MSVLILKKIVLNAKFYLNTVKITYLHLLDPIYSHFSLITKNLIRPMNLKGY